MKGKNKERMKAELEADRRGAELEWSDLKMTQLWFKDENKKQDTEVKSKLLE